MIVRSRAVFGALVLSAALGALAADAPIVAHGTLQAAFAPWDNVEDLVAETIRDARRQVLVQAYLLTSKTIAATLVEACRRGLDVRVMLDAQQLAKTATTAVSELAKCGIPVWLETRYQNAHNKVIVIDADTPEATVVTGSFNFTWTAQHKNAENVLIVRKNPALAALYAANWERHRQEATPYQK